MYFYCFNMRKRKSPNSLSEPVTHWNLLSSSTITVTFDFPLCITAVQLVGVHCNKYLSQSASFHSMCSCVFARYLLKTTDDDFFFFFPVGHSRLWKNGRDQIDTGLSLEFFQVMPLYILACYILHCSLALYSLYGYYHMTD